MQSNKRARLGQSSERPAKALKSALKPSAPIAPAASTSKAASKPARKPVKAKPAPSTALLPEEPADQPFDAFRIVAGSYERILVGLVGRFVLEEGAAEPQLQLTPIFNFPAHLSCIKTCAALDSSPPASNIPGAPRRKRQRAWLATAGTDETVKIWDLGRRREVGSLVASTGIVTKLAFASRNLLIAVSADSTMSLYSTEDPAWSLLRTLKGHMGRINDVAVHPAGRIALSVGQDRCLRMWDLFGSRSKGASGGKDGASSTKLGAEADAVRWNLDGTRFALILMNELRVFSTSMQLLHQINLKTRMQALRFVVIGSRELMLVACEDGRVRVLELPPIATNAAEPSVLSPIGELTGHASRVKSLEILSVVRSPIGNDVAQLAVTIASDGTVHAYDLATLASATVGGDLVVIEPLVRHETKGRLICLAVSGYYGSNDIETTSVVDPADLGGAFSSEDEDGSDGSDADSDPETGDRALEAAMEAVIDAVEDEQPWAGLSSDEAE